MIWTFLPNLAAIDALRAFRTTRSLAAYYCVADFGQLADRPDAARAAEAELLREVDVVFVGGRTLQRRFAKVHPRVRLASYAVGDPFLDSPQATVDRLSGIPRPRVGYVGGLHHHVDTRLLEKVVARLPGVQFVFLGPKVSELWAIERAPNAHFLGQRPYEELPELIDAFDVGIVPYRLTPFTETVWPTKLHEYLARGKPVVSTPLAEVVELRYDPDVVRVAGTPDETVDAIRSALAPGPGPRARRRSLAQEHSWRQLVAQMRREIEDRIRA